MKEKTINVNITLPEDSTLEEVFEYVESGNFYHDNRGRRYNFCLRDGELYIELD